MSACKAEWRRAACWPETFALDENLSEKSPSLVITQKKTGYLDFWQIGYTELGKFPSIPNLPRDSVGLLVRNGC